uniref:Uncharacterized protein n=1 Tax=Nelumbo nucifera TaxID=4432 RepID=A0A822ZP33_NELNU|nr:TPA_asm: hypothetical protein HUJ06_016604 [Nelumbo nucifera]
MTETDGDGNDDQYDENQEYNQPHTHPLPAALLIVLGSPEITHFVLHTLNNIHDIVLDVVQLLPLSFHHHRHVQEHLVQLKPALLNITILALIRLHRYFGAFGLWRHLLSSLVCCSRPRMSLMKTGLVQNHLGLLQELGEVMVNLILRCRRCHLQVDIASL